MSVTTASDFDIASVTVPELARTLGVSKTHLYRLAERNELPGAYRLGRRLLVHLSTFERETKAAAGKGAS